MSKNCDQGDLSMVRPLRIEYPGAFYHVTSRGNEQKDIFKSDVDREKFLSYLGNDIGVRPTHLIKYG